MRALTRRIALAAVMTGAVVGALAAGTRPAVGAPAPTAFRCGEADPVRQECVCAGGQFPDRNARGEAICAELRAPRPLSPEDGAELEAPPVELAVEGPRGALQIEVESCAGPSAAPRARCERWTVPVRAVGRTAIPFRIAARPAAPGVSAGASAGIHAQRWRARAWRGAGASAWSAPRRFAIRPRPSLVASPAPPAPEGAERLVGVHLGVPLGLEAGVAIELPRLEITAGKVWRRPAGPATGVIAMGWLDARSRAQPARATSGGGAAAPPATDLTLVGAAAALVLRWDGRRAPVLVGIGPAYQRAASAGGDAGRLGVTALAEVAIELRATANARWRLAARARVDGYLRGSAGQLAVISLGPEAWF